MHSILGSQSIGRRYEDRLELDRAYARELNLAAHRFNSVMQRPRFPSGILAVENFVDITKLLRNGIGLREFYLETLQKEVNAYPIKA